MSMVLYRAIRELARSPNQATLFGAFLTHEQHSCGLSAIRSWRFLFVIPTAGKIGTVGDCKSHRSVRLYDVDTTSGDDAESRISHHHEATQDGSCKHEREHTGIDCKEARVGQGLHEKPP